MRSEAPSTSGQHVLHGIGVSAGTVHGPVAIVSTAIGVDSSEAPSHDPEGDSATVQLAMQRVAEQLRARAERSSGNAKDVLSATAQLASDRGLLKTVTGHLRNGEGITSAVHNAVGEYAEKLQRLGGYMAERVADLHDVRDRVICELRGEDTPGVPELSEPSILVAKDLAPAETATLDPAIVLGIITEEGGPTSHTAILAAQLGIPAAVKVSGIVQAAHTSDELALDGGAGMVLVDPSATEITELGKRSARRTALLSGSHGQGLTKDGRHIALLANIGSAADATKAAALDLEGSGLFRTEFMFLDRQDAPSVEEQTDTYTRVIESFGNRRVVVRTLDAGADKPLAFTQMPEEENPALGIRGLRLGMRKQELLDTQLEALSRAYRATHGDLWVMAPMVADVDEAHYFAQKVRALGLPKVGVMIEVPAAALRASRVLREVDFASIGTNDLAQYTMAADRLNGELAGLLSPWQPAVLEMISFACKGGATTHSHIGVCGEAGGDPLLALVLVGLGVTSLSMAPKKVAAVRASLAMHDCSRCQEMAQAALDSSTAAQARDAVISMADPAVRDLL
ncbi:MAG: phosphoenolpyruvate--protein phosphotransferase [Bifidobacterium psychraerophilum]|uniref:phosphoenolpyruvate--protein phosphotransferase n=1 Tax=Bifidobacterium psychraerophilum TaxID=218140 RepID=UPI0039EBF027